MDGLALVIEAKGFTRPVRGGENGPWQVHLASGHCKDFCIPYRQTLDAALAVKDAAGGFAGTGGPRIEATLVFVPSIPLDSRAFPGNRKVPSSELPTVNSTRSVFRPFGNNPVRSTSDAIGNLLLRLPISSLTYSSEAEFIG